MLVTLKKNWLNFRLQVISAIIGIKLHFSFIHVIGIFRYSSEFLNTTKNPLTKCRFKIHWANLLFLSSRYLSKNSGWYVTIFISIIRFSCNIYLESANICWQTNGLTICLVTPNEIVMLIISFSFWLPFYTLFFHDNWIKNAFYPESLHMKSIILLNNDFVNYIGESVDTWDTGYMGKCYNSLTTAFQCGIHLCQVSKTLFFWCQTTYGIHFQFLCYWHGVENLQKLFIHFN